MSLVRGHAIQPHARPAHPPGGSPPRPARAEYGLGFFLFLIVNAALFIRPNDIFDELMGFEFYRYILLVCLAVSFPAVLDRLSPEKLDSRPIDVCVLALLPIVVLS